MKKKMTRQPIEQNTEHHFKDLYYHLYSNSSSSRSERILADLSKLIMVSLAFSRGRLLKEVRAFKLREGSANDLLIPALRREYNFAIQDAESFSLDDESLRHSLGILEKIDLAQSPSHTFGDAFQALMGPRLRGDKGQFFTPRSVVRGMVDILKPKSGMSIIDPACGTGGFLSAALDALHMENLEGTVTGIDKDSDLSLLATALSAVHAGKQKIQVHNANSLSLDALRSAGVRMGEYDLVLTNPPFGAKIGITDKPTLSNFELGRNWEYNDKKSVWQSTELVRPSQDPQVLFLELGVKLLRDGGKMGIVLPEGLFGNSRSGYVWDFLRANGSIEALIDCPRTTFQPGTDTKTNILIFRKDAKPRPSTKVWVAVAYSCGHDRRGRSVLANGDRVPDDFESIAADWNIKSANRKLWSNVSLSNPYYLVPRYYDQFLTDEVAADATRLGSVVTSLGDLIADGYLNIRKGNEVGSEAYGSGEIPFIRTSDIHNFEASSDPTNCVSEEIYLQYRSQQNLKSGDILMVVDGRYKIGRCAILHDWNKKCVVQSHIKILSLTKKAKFNPYALLYGLSLPSVQSEIRRLVFIQSTLGGLGQRIAEIRLPDPRQSESWSDTLNGFQMAIAKRAEYAAFLRTFGNEVEL